MASRDQLDARADSRRARLQNRLRTAGSLSLYVIAGLGVGVGGNRLAALYDKHQSQVQFAHSNVHIGNFRGLLQTIGHGDPIMVTLPGCSHCEDARQWLRPRHIHVVEIPMGTNPAISKVMRAFNAWGTPTLITSTTLIQGFQPAAWATALP